MTAIYMFIYVHSFAYRHRFFNTEVPNIKDQLIIFGEFNLPLVNWDYDCDNE